MIDIHSAFSQHLLQLTVTDAVFAVPAYGPQNDVTLKMPAFEWVHVQLHQQKGDDKFITTDYLQQCPESQGEYDSQWAAICSIAPKTGCTPETLRVWVRQYERDTGGGDGGLTSAERQRLKELERENRELRRSNNILRPGFRLFCEGGVRPPLEKVMALLDKLREQYGREFFPLIFF